MAVPAVEFSFDFTYDGEKTPALKNITGKIERGKCVVLCGGSGCGKTTVLRCLNHLIPQFYEGELKGFARIGGQNLEELSIGQTGKRAASVFQDPRSQFFTLNSNHEVAFGLENFGFSHEEMAARVEEAFSVFQLERLKNRNVFSLSSGERQLVAILSAWAMDTDVLLLDEPTANLDAAAISQLSQMLSVLKGQGKTLLISEHRLSYLKDVADEFWLMEAGEFKTRFEADELAKIGPEGLAQLGLRVLDQNQVTQKSHPLPNPEKTDTLCVQQIHFRYGKKEQDVLRGMDLTAQTGEVVGLLGSNGCGKTTLGKLIAGLQSPRSGQISLNGKPLNAKTLSDQSIFIMQEAEFQFFTNSVIHELSYGASDWENEKEEAEELLKLTGLWECRNRHPFSLSGGQMQKLVMLLACLSSKPVVILDEPTAGLDQKSLQVCADLIRRMQKNRIVLLISHDLELLSMACTQGVLLCDGKAAETFDLTAPHEFERMREELTRHLKPPQRPAVREAEKPHLDPRAKLLFMMTAMIAGIFTDLPLIYAVFAALMCAAGYERNWKLLLSAASAMVLIDLPFWLWPNVATSFLVYFFPRIILMGCAAAMVIPSRELPRTLAGIRALHISEKVNMIFSVISRFFPVLHGDLHMMNQSIRTRGFFSTWGQKLRAAPDYLEIMIVPMVFRVLRIAEALSASAETRGIALEGRRESYTAIGWHRADSWMTGLLVVLTGIGIIL